MLVILMLLLAALGAVPVRTLLAIGANTPGTPTACSCCGECICPSCSTHHPDAPAPGPGLHAADCGGCAPGGGSGVPVPAPAVFETPTRSLPTPEARIVAIVDDASDSKGTAIVRVLDPPPRSTAA